MANGPEQGGNPESPLQRKIRETREYIRKHLGQIDSDAQKTEDQKSKEKEQIAKNSQEELKRQLEHHENIPEDRRDHDKAAEDVMTSVNELAELVKHKAIRNLPVIASSVVEALAKKSISPRKAILLGKIVNDIVESPEFRATTEAAEALVKERLRDLVANLRGGNQNEIADIIDNEIQASEPKPNPENVERAEDVVDREPIEKFLDKHYRKIKGRVDPNTGEFVPGDEGWLDVLDQRKGGYLGMTPELQRSLLGIALRSQIDLTHRQNVIIRAFDGGDEFRAYFRAMRDLLAEKASADGTPKKPEDITVNEAYKAMSNDLKDVVRELLSSLSGTVDAGNQKESQFIKLIAEDRISRNIRTEIAGDTEMDIPGSIKLEGTDAMLPMEGQTNTTDPDRKKDPDSMLIGGMTEYLVPRDIKVSMTEALVDDLASTITKLQKITTGFHNARNFAYNGGSHKDFGEQLKKDGVKPADLVWAFKKEDDVNLAYNLFIQSLQQFKAQTARTITERYGSMSKAGGLTEAEYRAYIQLLSLDDKYRKAEDLYARAVDSKDKRLAKLQKKAMDRIEQNKRRAIKMASGIAWGHSKEAWGVLLDAQLLVKRTKDSEGNYTISQHYGGSQSSGIEKMVAELHPSISDNRWGRDKIAPIWMLYQPRDLDAAEDNKWKRKEMYSHTRLYDLYEQHQQAFYQGRSDDLADFDDEYITVHEFANVTSLHMLRRESWRLRQYELYSNKYAEEAQKRDLKGKAKNEYIIKRLMVRGGPRLVKMYIDKKLEDMMEVDRDIDSGLKSDIKKAKRVEVIEGRIGEESDKDRKTLAKGRKAERAIKEKYFEKYIFDDISKRFATSLIALEQPRYMPSKETTLYTALNSYIEKQPIFANLPQNVLQTEVYPVFIDAIHTVERNKWEKYSKSKDGDIGDQIGRQLEPPKDLTDADFDDPDIISKLKTHYKLNQQRMGEITEDKYKLDADFNDYLKTLKGFHRKLVEERDNENRRDRNSGGKKQSLSKRYAHMLTIDQGGVNNALGGSYFDFSLEIQQGGVDALNRLSGDVNKSAEMTEAWEKLTGDGGALEKFAMSCADEEADIKSGAKSIAEAISDIVKYPYSFSPDQGNEYKVRHEIFWARAFAKPEVYKGPFGTLNEFNWRNMRGGETTLFGEYYRKVLARTDVTTLDSDDVRIMLDTMEHELRVPPTKFETAEYENVGDMNVARRTVRKLEDRARHIPLIGPAVRGTLRSLTSPFTEAGVKKYRTHEYNQNMALRELGARKRDIFTESLFTPSFWLTLFAGAVAFGKAADESMKKKH